LDTDSKGESAPQTRGDPPSKPGDVMEKLLGKRQWEPWRLVTLAGVMILIVGLTAFAILTRQGPSAEFTRSMTELVGTGLRALAFAGLVGVAAMALLQTTKVLLRLRGKYQERQVLLWIYHRHPAGSEQAMRELLEGLGGHRSGQVDRGDLRRLFDLPIEQVTAQIGAVADLAVAEPSRYQELLRALAGRPATARSRISSRMRRGLPVSPQRRRNRGPQRRLIRPARRAGGTPRPTWRRRRPKSKTAASNSPNWYAPASMSSKSPWANAGPSTSGRPP